MSWAQECRTQNGLGIKQKGFSIAGKAYVSLKIPIHYIFKKQTQKQKQKKKEKNKQANKQANEQTSKRANKQTSKQANKQTKKNT